MEPAEWIALAWAIAAIVALFEADTILSHFTTTTQAKERLMNATAKMAKDLNLTPDQTAKIMAQTQSEAGGTNSSSILDIIKLAAVTFIGITLVGSLNKSK